jgi:hypothetical protein
MITEPRWRSFIVETTTPIFTPEQCKMIIEAGELSLNNKHLLEQGIKELKEEL